MTAAILLTLVAVAGVIAGVLLGEGRVFSSYLTAAGGGLLFGISIFWLLPESAAASGWLAASAMTAGACLILIVLDRAFLHSQMNYGRVALGPLLAATAVHCFIDGWSVRALLAMRTASVTAPLGLALHKIPEGVALGWVARQRIKSPSEAAAAAIAVELLTVLGALVEPHANRSGFAAFGSWWTSAVVAIIGGSFLFFGIHALVPNRRRAGAILVFLGTLALMATISLYRVASL